MKLQFRLLTQALACILSGLFPALAQSDPEYLPEIRTEIYDTSAIGKGGIFLSNYKEMGLTFQSDPLFNASVMILDNDGTPIYSKNIGATKGIGLVDFKMHPNGMISFPRAINNYLWTGGGEVIHMVMDKSFHIVDSFQMGNGYVAETHDFRLLPNGHALLMGYYLVPADLSKKVPGGQPNALVDGAVIQELDENKNVVFQWRTWDYLSLDMIPWAMVQGNTQQIVNAFHLNALTMDRDGNLLLGTPAMGMKISRQTGEIMWILGGMFNQFSFENVDSMQALGDFGGHTFHRLENGNVLVYDNSPFPWQPGAGSVSAEAVEYTLDEETKTAERIWKYTPVPLVAGWHAGSAQRLPNGNTVIGWGGPPVDSTSLVFTEVSPEGNKVMDVFFEGDKVESYRAFRFSLDDGEPETEATVAEIAPGNTYEFLQGDTLDTGISIRVNGYSGSGYNEFKTEHYNFAPVYPKFAGKSPRVIPKRIVCSGLNISSLDVQVRFDASLWDIANPDSAVVYHREYPGHGLFLPLETDYNPVTGEVRGNANKFGEFIIGYPDATTAVFAPALLLPADSALVIKEIPVELSWNPKGYISGYDLQIATDPDFEELVADETYLTSALYTLEATEPLTTYYWRVKAMNDAGESEWSETNTFISSEPYLHVIAPNGHEVIARGLEHFIEWEGNLADTVSLELFLNHELVAVIDTVVSDFPERMYYKWEYPFDLDSTCGYFIKITSLNNPSVTDRSDSTFAVNDSSCLNAEVQFIAIKSPIEGDILTKGNTYDILWDENLSETVIVELMRNGAPVLQIAIDADEGSYSWQIPAEVDPSDSYYFKITSTSNENIYGVSGIFTIDEAVSINDMDTHFQFSLAPNPTQGRLHLAYTLNQDYRVEASLYTLTGNKIRTFFGEDQGMGQHTSSYDISSLPKGVYLVKISFDQKEINRKVIVQ